MFLFLIFKQKHELVFDRERMKKKFKFLLDDLKWEGVVSLLVLLIVFVEF